MTSFDRKTGRYQARSGTGNEKRAEGTFDLPEDVHNGLTWILLKNLPSRTQFEGAMFLNGPRWRIELSAPLVCGALTVHRT